MPDSAASITSDVVPTEIPPLTGGLAEFAAFCCGLLSGVWERIGDAFHLGRRSNGYQTADLVTTLLALHCSPEFAGAHELCGFVRSVHGEGGARLAAISGRSRWPSQSAVSRMLGCVSEEQAHEISDWLLTSSLDFSGLWQAEASLHRDCLGAPVHVFSFDPTVDPVRRRALPEGPELPAPIRHSDEFAAPGYAGRKRGESQVSRGVLQHRGTGLWHLASMTSGNSDMQTELRRVTKHLDGWCARTGTAPQNVVVVVDGCGGGNVQIHELAASSVSFVTRSAAYHLLTQEALQEVESRNQWTRVTDSLSGPERWASELGIATNAEGAEVRLIVTRFVPHAAKKRGAGKFIEGMQYELFATDLSADAWPANEVVTLYYGRCGQENHFAREDQEVGLGRVFSFNPGGQLLACAVGMWLWNLRILRGFLHENGLPQAADLPDKPGVTASSVETKPTETMDTTVLATAISSMPNWSVCPESDNPVCPAGHTLRKHRITKPNAKKRVQLRFRALKSQCKSCPMREQCTSSTNADFQKELVLTVPAGNPSSEDVTPVRTHMRALQPPKPAAPAKRRVRRPILCASALSKVGERHRKAMIATVLLTRPRSRKRRAPHYIKRTDAERQHRRRTRAEARGWNAQHPGAETHVRFYVPNDSKHPLVSCAEGQE